MACAAILACLTMPAVLTSCQKEIPPLSINLTIPADGISLQQGESAEIPFAVTNIPEGGGTIEVAADSDNDLFEISSTSEGTGESGTISVQAPELIYSPCTVNITVTAKATGTGETAAAYFTVSAVMYDGYLEISSPANCYIVSPGAFVKFPANIGNSSEKASFTTAELLWQDTQGLVSSISADTENGAVYAMLAPETSGNAVIAVKNAEGIITWNYHLWVTDFDPDANVMEWTSSATSTSYKIMDRYLGALSNEPGSDLSNGLFYQWGRKDPYVSSDYAGALKPMYDMAGNAVEKVIKPCDAADNIANSIANPLTHYSGVSGGDWSWITNDPSFLTSETLKDLWGGDSGNKSKYDPCPDGWQVIPADGWGFINDENTMIEIVFNPEVAEPANKDQFGRMISVGGKSFYFPSQGEVQHSGDYANGIGTNWPCGRAWSATVDANGKCLSLSATPSSFYTDSAFGLGYELPVRCVKM